MILIVILVVVDVDNAAPLEEDWYTEYVCGLEQECTRVSSAGIAEHAGLVKYVYAIENRRQGTCAEAQGRGQGRARCRDYKTMFSSVSGRVGEWE